MRNTHPLRQQEHHQGTLIQRLLITSNPSNHKNIRPLKTLIPPGLLPPPIPPQHRKRLQRTTRAQIPTQLRKLAPNPIPRRAVPVPRFHARNRQRPNHEAP